MMSKPVTSTELGRNCLSAGQFATTSPRSFFTRSCDGQPSVENGHSADENHVSSTSSSWRNAPIGDTLACVRASVSSSPTKMLPASSYHAGMRCPHHNWREMHQSWMLSSHCVYVVVQFSGTN